MKLITKMAKFLFLLAFIAAPYALSAKTSDSSIYGTYKLYAALNRAEAKLERVTSAHLAKERFLNQVSQVQIGTNGIRIGNSAIECENPEYQLNHISPGLMSQFQSNLAELPSVGITPRVTETLEVDSESGCDVFFLRVNGKFLVLIGPHMPSLIFVKS